LVQDVFFFGVCETGSDPKAGSVVCDFCQSGQGGSEQSSCAAVPEADLHRLNRSLSGRRGICPPMGGRRLKLTGSNNEGIPWIRLAQPYPERLCHAFGGRVFESCLEVGGRPGLQREWRGALVGWAEARARPRRLDVPVDTLTLDARAFAWSLRHIALSRLEARIRQLHLVGNVLRASPSTVVAPASTMR